MVAGTVAQILRFLNCTVWHHLVGPASVWQGMENDCVGFPLQCKRPLRPTHMSSAAHRRTRVSLVLPAGVPTSPPFMPSIAL